MMKKAIIFIADGFEEIEALTIVDVLRRADIEADMCSIGGELEVKGAHHIEIKADLRLRDIDDIESYARHSAGRNAGSRQPEGSRCRDRCFPLLLWETG